MKRRWPLILVCLLAGIWFAVRMHRHGSEAAPYQETNARQTQAAKVNEGLRSLVLQGNRDNFGLGPASKPDQPFAVVTDFATSGGADTIVAIADGSASVYLDGGRSFIGGGQAHEAIHNAALKVVSVANEAQTLMHPTTEYPLPLSGQVNFYAVTDEGVFTASASEDDLRTHRSPLSKLADATQAIKSEYEKARKSP